MPARPPWKCSIVGLELDDLADRLVLGRAQLLGADRLLVEEWVARVEQGLRRRKLPTWTARKGGVVRMLMAVSRIVGLAGRRVAHLETHTWNTASSDALVLTPYFSA
jgi:hypothetical protein